VEATVGFHPVVRVVGCLDIPILRWAEQAVKTCYRGGSQLDESSVRL